MNIMYYGMRSYGGTNYLFEGITHILIWALIIVVIFVIIRRLNRPADFWNRMRNIGDGNQAALNILKERLAKGEINKEEFEEKKKLLS